MGGSTNASKCCNGDGAGDNSGGTINGSWHKSNEVDVKDNCVKVPVGPKGVIKKPTKDNYKNR